ncbi:BapA/Bap/LapF family large adhesin [Acinetobacter wuhouensis]|nr:BapA/Bap/LapF family large adhesin [Acinetobacter wuhouensis]
MANLLDSVLTPVGGVLDLVSNIIKVAGFKPNSDVTISFYDAITNALIKAIVVQSDARGRIEYTTSEFINGETAIITGINPQGFDIKSTQVLKDFAPPVAPTVSINAAGSLVSGITEPGALIKIKNQANEVIATTVADQFGKFAVALVPPRIASEQLSATASDNSASHNESVATQFTAPDLIPPVAPANLAVVQDGSVVTGKAEPNSKIEIKDSKGQVIGTGTTDQNGAFSVTLTVPQKDSQQLIVNAIDTAGNKSPDAIVNALDLTPPPAPNNLAVVNNGTVVTGKAEANSKIEIKDPSGKIIGTGLTDATGSFAVTLTTPQKDSQKLTVNASDASGNKSPDATVIALDLTPPPVPTNLAVVNDGTVVTGKAEANSKIEIKDPSGKLIGTGLTDATGSFAVTLTTPQKDSQKLAVNAFDAAGNKSPDATVNALDLTPPPVPTNLAVVNDGTVVTGKAEVNSKIVIRDPAGNIIGTGTTDANGLFSVGLTIAQKDSQKLTVNAFDAAGNKSPDGNVQALDLTPPDLGTPLFNATGNQVSGTAEANSNIAVKNALGTVIGTTVTGADGKFVVNLDKAYGAGEKISVTATDAAGNSSLPKAAIAPVLLHANDDVVRADLDLGYTSTSSTYSETKGFGSIFKFFGISFLGKPAAEINFTVGETQATSVDISSTNAGFGSFLDSTRITLYKQNTDGSWAKVVSSTDTGLFNAFFFFFPQQARLKTVDSLAQGNYKIIAEDTTAFSFFSANSLSVTYTTTNKSTTLDAQKANVVSGNVLADDVTTAGTQVSKLVNSDGKGADIASTGTTTLVGKYGTMLIKADGSYSYTPNKDSSNIGKVDTFTYTIKNANGNTSEAKVFVQIGSDEVKVKWDPTDPSKFGTTLQLFNDLDTVKSNVYHTTSQSSVSSGSITTSSSRLISTTSNTFNIDNNAESTIKVAFKAAYGKSFFGSTVSTTQDPDNTTFKWQLQKFNKATNQWENVVGASGSKFIGSSLSNSITSGNEVLNAEFKINSAGQYRVDFSASTSSWFTSSYDTSVQVTTTNLNDWYLDSFGTATGNIFNGVGVETTSQDTLGIGSKLSISKDGGVTFETVSASGNTIQGVNGVLTIKADGSYNYSQTGYKYATEDFVYKVTNSNGETATAHLNIGYEHTIQGSAASEVYSTGSIIHVLQMGAGADTVKFTALNTDEHGDIWSDFSKAEGDKIDVSSLLSGKGVTASNISQYVTVEQSGKDAVVKIDLDGKGTQYTPKELVILENNTLALDDLLKGNHIIY